MTLVTNGLLGPLLITGGLGISVIPPVSAGFPTDFDPRGTTLIGIPFDARSTTLIPQVNPFGIDPRAATLIPERNPFGINPRGTKQVP